MTYPDAPIEGTVESIGFGIAQQDGATGVDLLPSITPTFEWIRLAQRVPVRVHIVHKPDNVVLRVGTTASVLVMFAFEGGYHGRTLGASAITSSYRYRRRYGHFGDRACFIPYPYCFRCSYGKQRDDCDLYCLKQFARLFETEYYGVWDAKVGQAEYAAFYVEAIQGTGGYVIPPKGYFQALKAVLDAYHILLVDDEIQMGFFRTGKFWAMAVITGTSVGGQTTLEDSFTKLIGTKNPRAHPLTVPRLMSNAGSSHISMLLGITGPGFTVASACASAVHAIGVTLGLLRSGVVDRAITGGAEACLTFGTLKGWEALRVMAPDVCRPFSAGRAGMVLGEGAAMLVLETLEAAEARGAKIYAELAGVGMTSDARDITTPDVGGAARAIAAALKDAGLVPADIDYINAHGTGTRINDVMETAALKAVFGDRARSLAISASKSLFGHGRTGCGRGPGCCRK